MAQTYAPSCHTPAPGSVLRPPWSQATLTTGSSGTKPAVAAFGLSQFDTSFEIIWQTSVQQYFQIFTIIFKRGTPVKPKNSF
jgi:hypothetical protein